MRARNVMKEAAKKLLSYTLLCWSCTVDCSVWAKGGEHRQTERHRDNYVYKK